MVAGAAGIPYLIDPQTFYLQDEQHSADPWAQLPFASPDVSTLSDLLDPHYMAGLVQETVQFQLVQGAAAVIPPYFHLERPDRDWARAQALAYVETRKYLDSHNVALPVIAVVALGWRSLHGPAVVGELGPLWRALQALRPEQVALAASGVHTGVTAQGRLIDLLRLISMLSKRHPVIAWQQGLLGEICVAGGAAGYETGIGWRERCELQSKMREHANPPSDGFGAQPVYVDAVGRGVPKNSLAALRSRKSLWRQLVCVDAACCPPAGDGLLADARAHGVRARKSALSAIDMVHNNHWRWTHMQKRLASQLRVATAINHVSDSLGIYKVDITALSAQLVVAEQLRQRQRGALPPGA